MSEITLSEPQRVFLEDLNTPYRAYIGGYGSGKSFVGAFDTVRFIARNPGYDTAYYGPTYASIRDIFYPTITHVAGLLGFTVTVKETHKEVHLFRDGAFYGRVLCRSMDNPDSIVGYEVAKAHVDEIDTLNPKKAKAAWNRIIARMRLPVPGVTPTIGVTTTPEGYGFVYLRFARDPRPEYAMVQASTLENAGNLPDNYIENLRSTYPANLATAYLEGQFVNLTSGSVYGSYDRAACGCDDQIQPGETLYVGMDFNILNMAATFCVRRGAQWRAVSELKKVSDTPGMIRMIKDRWPGRSIVIYPDASGRAGSSTNAALSDLALLRQAGFSVRAKAANPRVRDRVAAVNRALENGTLKVNTATCPRLAECLERQAYDDDGDPDKTAGYDHMNDALGYLVAYELPIVHPLSRATLLGV